MACSDEKHFQALKSIDLRADNWVLRFNGLKKVWKLMGAYFGDRGLSLTALGSETPNLTAIAKGQKSMDLERLIKPVVVLCIQSEQNELYVSRIQRLDHAAQHSMMLAINQVRPKGCTCSVNPHHCRVLTSQSSGFPISPVLTAP